MNLLLRGILARANRDHKVKLCGYIWMGNHIHLLVVTRDPFALVSYYSEIEKKVTDMIKALLGLEHLNLWEHRPVVARVADEQSCLDQVTYLYVNPARANLVSSVEEYPGASSWHEFRDSRGGVDLELSRDVYWVSAAKVPKLPSATMGKHASEEFAGKLKELGKPCKLVLYPNAWMK
jgi:REP element-mobilizing transposase RayT